MTHQPDLRDLLIQAADHRQIRLSGRGLTELAQDAGHKITNTTINALLARTYKSRPGQDTVRAIAWLAEVPVETAFAAAGQPPPGIPFADELPPGSDHLSPKSRAAVIALLRILIEHDRPN